MCNITIIYFPPHLLRPNVARLPWEIIQVHNDTCKLKTLGLLLHSLNTTRLTAQPIEFKLSYYSKCLKCLPFSLTQALSLLCHSLTASSITLRQSVPCVSQALLKIGHVSNWRLINTILHNTSYSICLLYTSDAADE